eukprot:COSAG01_NODE_2598_length_7399_cov_4.972740_3_plen_205_part_00
MHLPTCIITDQQLCTSGTSPDLQLLCPRQLGLMCCIYERHPALQQFRIGSTLTSTTLAQDAFICSLPCSTSSTLLAAVCLIFVLAMNCTCDGLTAPYRRHTRSDKQPGRQLTLTYFDPTFRVATLNFKGGEVGCSRRCAPRSPSISGSRRPRPGSHRSRSRIQASELCSLSTADHQPVCLPACRPAACSGAACFQSTRRLRLSL